MNNFDFSKYKHNEIYKALIISSPYTEKELKKKTRERPIVRHRQVFYYACNGDQTLKSKGKTFDQDHATVLHGKKTVMNMIDTNDKQTIGILKKLINNLEEDSFSKKKLIEEIRFNCFNMSEQSFNKYMKTMEIASFQK